MSALISMDEHRRFAVLVLERDLDAITEWVSQRATSPERAFEILFVTATVAGNLANEAIAKGARFDDDHFWKLELHGATGAKRLAGQIISTALNEDLDTLEALVEAVIPPVGARESDQITIDFEDVLAEVIGFYHGVLNVSATLGGDQA